ncbi:MAG: hypothetical protein EP326_02700 [Deltaproteobacteria bacterium]|nr:MAG: hypothetical protein EP326_02700 [Deltaproteobacteria bacterium]
MKKLIPLLFLLSSCTFFINAIDNGSYDVVDVDGKGISVVYSGNINGETHPCGCRHFPLGGLPNVAAQMAEIQKTNEMVYVDAGDTFFPSSTLPSAMKDSLTFAAKNLATALSKLGLKYFVPGDQDFAGGYEFLRDLLKNNKIKMLAANISKKEYFDNKKWFVVKKGPHKIFITGLVERNVLPTQFRYLFTDETKALAETLKEMEDYGYKKDDPFSRLIIVSNAGIDPDKELAKANPQIDWIIGAHSQSFTTSPFETGNTKLVQVLSRNHYLGEIKIDVTKDKKGDDYKMHEMRQEVGKKIDPNPWYEFIDKHKETLSKIQKEEQEKMTVIADENARINTAASCIDCHSAQADKWQTTAHSNAYATLVNAKEENNLNCIGCHSVGLNKKGGFKTAKEMLIFSDDQKEDKNKLLANYMTDLKKTFGKIPSIRKLDMAKQRELNKKWLAQDSKYKVTHNYMNVQCMNCHDKHVDHPFENHKMELTDAQKKEAMQDKCLSCHDPDQSPEWYSQGGKGNVDYAKLDEMMKKVACPKKVEEN